MDFYSLFSFFLLLAANKFIIILLFAMIQKNDYCTCWPHIKFVLIWNFIFSLYSQTLKQHIVCKWMKKKIKTKTVRSPSCSEFGFKISWKNQIFYDSLKKNNSIKIRCCTLPVLSVFILFTQCSWLFLLRHSSMLRLVLCLRSPVSLLLLASCCILVPFVIFALCLW